MNSEGHKQKKQNKKYENNRKSPTKQKQLEGKQYILRGTSKTMKKNYEKTINCEGHKQKKTKIL